MPVSPQMAGTAQGRDVGGLALSCVQVDNPMTILRAAHWRNALSKVGLPVPLFAVHDLGVARDAGRRRGADRGARRAAQQLPLSPERAAGARALGRRP